MSADEPGDGSGKRPKRPKRPNEDKPAKRRRSGGRSRRRVTILVIVGVGVVAAGFAVYGFVLAPKIDRYRMLHQAGEPAGSVIGGGVVVVLDDVSVSRYHKDAHSPRESGSSHKTRLTAYDAATGAQVGQALADGAGECALATESSMFCTFGGKILLYDLRLGGAVVDVVQDLARSGLAAPLRGGPKVAPILLAQLDGPRASLLLEDGELAVYDASRHALRAESQVPVALRHLRRETSIEITAAAPPGCGATRPTGGGRSRVTAGGVTSKDTFLGPVAVGASEPALVLHHTSLNQQRDSIELSRLDRSGATAWTFELGGGCEQLAAIGKTVVVTTTNTDRRAIALDLESGKPVWTVSR